MKKSKTLFILHLPDPVHGAAMVGKYIKESKIINNALDADYINLSTSNQLNEVGKAGTGKLINLLKIQFKVLKALIKKRYDVCYITLSATAPGFYKDFLIVLILKLFGQKIIYHLHNKGVSSRQNNKLDNVLYKFTFNRTKTILLSPFLYTDIKKYVKKDDVFFCANGIPEITDLSSDRKVSSRNNRCKLLFLSNMMIEKGVFILLEACKLLKEKGIDFECHYVGAWFDVSEEEFSKRVSLADLNQHVYAHGKKYGGEKLNFFNNSDIFVFPTYYHNECFPLVLLEAMQFCLPVIATSEGGIADAVIDEETGFLVAQQDVTALSDKIELLIKQPQLRLQMGIAGKRQFYDLFTLNKFENRLLDILKETIEC